MNRLTTASKNVHVDGGNASMLVEALVHGADQTRRFVFLADQVGLPFAVANEHAA